jgi:hypothetical protein
MEEMVDIHQAVEVVVEQELQVDMVVMEQMV